jgi:hypothetical protein
MNENIKLSNLNKTWFFDLDGTLVKHNGYKTGKEEILNGIKSFFDNNIKEGDVVIATTARSSKDLKEVKKLFKKNNICINVYISGLPVGERLLFNDIKDSGLKTAYSFNLIRDEGLNNYKFLYEDEDR